MSPPVSTMAIVRVGVRLFPHRNTVAGAHRAKWHLAVCMASPSARAALAQLEAAEVWWRVGTRLVGHKPYHSNVRVLVIPDPEPK